MDFKEQNPIILWMGGLQLPTMINSDQLFSKYETLLQRTILDYFFYFE